MGDVPIFLLLSFSLMAGLGLPRALGQMSTSARYEGLIVDRVDLSPDGPLSGISEDRLRSLLTLQPGDRYSAIGVKQCLQRLYSSHLFSDIQADVRLLSAGHVALDFRLARMVLIRNVSFSGDKKLDPSQLLRETGFHDQDPFDREALDAALAQLSAFYEKNGFFRCRLRPRLSYVRDSSLVDIDFEVQSGEQARVGTLTFDIEPPANVSALRQEITTGQGRKYSGVVLEQDIQNLSRQFSLLGYLDADVYVKENAYHAEDNSVSVTIRVNPKDFVHVDVHGAKLSYRDRWELMPLYSERNAEPVFVQESARNLTRFLQEDGKFLATVRPAIHPDPPHTIIFDTAAGKSLSLAEIRFENIGSVNENDLRAVLGLKTASFLSRGVYSSAILAADVDRLRNLYVARGYVNARVAPRMETSGADLIVIFRVLPGPQFRVRSVKLEGNRFFDESHLLSLLQTIPDGVYSPQTVAFDRSALINAYEDAGFSNVDFHTDVQFPSLALADVTYHLNEGDRYTIERVVIAGNRTTREEVIRRQLTFAPGEPVSLEKLLASESNLYNLGIFNRVTIDPEPTFRDPLQKMLLVRVEEAKRYTLTYGAGYEDADPRVTVGLSDNNNLGRARTLATALRAGLRQQRGQVSYSIPQPFGLRLPTIVSLLYQHEQKRKGDLQQDLGKPFDTTRMTALLQSERRLNSQTSLFLRYNYERVTVSNIEEIEVLFRENRPVRLSHISASLLNDRRDDALDAARGTFSSVDLQLVPRFLGSEAQLGRLFLQQQYFHSITPGLVVAVSGRFGWLQPFGKNSVDRSLPPELQNPIPISERFFAGGSTSLRGFRLDQAGPLFEKTIAVNGKPEKRLLPVGGDALLIWNSELRFPILGPLRGAIFYDTGNVFRKVSDISFEDFSHAVGFGVRIRTPFGPVRADFGYNLNPPQNFQKRLFFFTIGQTF